MKSKLILLTFILSMSFASSGLSNSYSGFCHSKKAEYESCAYQGYNYVRVLINGHWWIIVYDEDGFIVNIYEDDE
jgi:hypothetical protein